MGAKNQETLASYERIAHSYAESTRGTPDGELAVMMRQMIDSRPHAGAILELGSGPGWDADFIESLGAEVRRTDATKAFCDFQVSRGRVAERLDAITDSFTDVRWPHYDGAMAMYVLQHIERKDTPLVLEKVAAALTPGGTFLVSIRDGVGEECEGDSAANRYHVTLWEERPFKDALIKAGLEPLRIVHSVDAEGPWLILLARKPG